MSAVVDPLLLIVEDGCSFCGPVYVPEGDPGPLVVRIGTRAYCAQHWIRAGRPWPRDAADPKAALAAEIRTRERMQARGGTDRHLVRNGKT